VVQAAVKKALDENPTAKLAFFDHVMSMPAVELPVRRVSVCLLSFGLSDATLPCFVFLPFGC